MSSFSTTASQPHLPLYIDVLGSGAVACTLAGYLKVNSTFTSSLSTDLPIPFPPVTLLTRHDNPSIDVELTHGLSDDIKSPLNFNVDCCKSLSSNYQTYVRNQTDDNPHHRFVICTTKAYDAVSAIKDLLLEGSDNDGGNDGDGDKVNVVKNYNSMIHLVIISNGSLAIYDELCRSPLMSIKNYRCLNSISLVSTTLGSYLTTSTNNDKTLNKTVTNVSPGLTIIPSKPMITMSDEAHYQPPLHALKSLLSPSAVSILSRDEMYISLWEKLGVNSIINPLSVIKRCVNGEVLKPEVGTRSGKGGGIEVEGKIVDVDKLIGDIVTVGRWDLKSREPKSGESCTTSSTGKEFTIPSLRKLVDNVIVRTKLNRSSMLQDLEKGATRTEIEYFNGFIIDKRKEMMDGCDDLPKGEEEEWGEEIKILYNKVKER